MQYQGRGLRSLQPVIRDRDDASWSAHVVSDEWGTSEARLGCHDRSDEDRTRRGGDTQPVVVVSSSSMRWQRTPRDDDHAFVRSAPEAGHFSGMSPPEAGFLQPVLLPACRERDLTLQVVGSDGLCANLLCVDWTVIGRVCISETVFCRSTDTVSPSRVANSTPFSFVLSFWTGLERVGYQKNGPIHGMYRVKSVTSQNPKVHGAGSFFFPRFGEPRRAHVVVDSAPVCRFVSCFSTITGKLQRHLCDRDVCVRRTARAERVGGTLSERVLRRQGHDGIRPGHVSSARRPSTTHRPSRRDGNRLVVG